MMMKPWQTIYNSLWWLQYKTLLPTVWQQQTCKRSHRSGGVWHQGGISVTWERWVWHRDLNTQLLPWCPTDIHGQNVNSKLAVWWVIYHLLGPLKSFESHLQNIFPFHPPFPPTKRRATNEWTKLRNSLDLVHLQTPKKLSWFPEIDKSRTNRTFQLSEPRDEEPEIITKP